jgi:hypothetical protein
MYPEAVSEILVFKTSLVSESDIHQVSILLNAQKEIRHWNIDQQDVDHVLRVEGDLPASEVIVMLQASGFHCEELPD